MSQKSSLSNLGRPVIFHRVPTFPADLVELLWSGRWESGNFGTWPRADWSIKIFKGTFFWGHPLELDILTTWPRFSIFKFFRGQIRMQISDALSFTIAQIVNRWTSSHEVSCDIAGVIWAKMS